jgi:hypothetical protein
MPRMSIKPTLRLVSSKGEEYDTSTRTLVILNRKEGDRCCLHTSSVHSSFAITSALIYAGTSPHAHTGTWAAANSQVNSPMAPPAKSPVGKARGDQN